MNQRKQTLRIIEYQQGMAAGLINQKEEQQNTSFYPKYGTTFKSSTSG